MGVTLSQFFPPTPELTEANLPSQEGKVFIVTGGYSGVGLELTKILYKAGAKVYIAGRSETTAQTAIENLKSSAGPANDNSAFGGQLEFLYLNLADLSSLKHTAHTFLEKESKLHVLWNNAAVSLPPSGSKTAQGYDLQLGTNCLGPFLLTQFLRPALCAAASDAPAGSVRVVWSSSQVVDLQAPKHGFAATHFDHPEKLSRDLVYCSTKLGNWYLAAEFGKQVQSDGIVSLTQNPGNLKTNLLRNAKWAMFISYPLLYPARMGALTELWAGLSEGGVELNGAYVVPWGKLHPSPRADLIEAVKRQDEGGLGRAEEFWNWCEKKTTGFH